MAAIMALVEGPLPHIATLRILPIGALSLPSALLPVAQGTPSQAVTAERIFEGLVRVVRELEGVYLPRAGLRSDVGRFFPTRSTWREEWLGFAEAQYQLLSATGMDLPAARGLIHAIRDEAHLLPDSVVPTLVHFGLRPQALTFTQGGLAQVGEWWQSFAGDSLAGWAPLLARLHGEPLQGLLHAAGTETVEEISEPENLVRLRIYTRTRALFELRAAAQDVVYSPSELASSRWGTAVAHAVRLCEPTPLSRAIRGESSPPATPPSSLRVGLCLRAAVQLPADRLPNILSAFGTLALHQHLTRARPLADQLLHGVRVPTFATFAPAIKDRAHWLERMHAAVVDGDSGPALALWAEMFELAQGPWLPDVALRGLEAWLEALHQSHSTSAPRRLLGALLGLDGALRLGTPLQAWHDQITDAVDVLGHADTGVSSSAEQLIEELETTTLVSRPESLYVAALVAALWRMEAAEALPGDPHTLAQLTQSG